MNKGKLKVYLPSITASIVLLIVGQVLSKGFASANNIGSILTVASVLAIASIAQTLVILTGNEGIDLSVGAVMSMGALFGPLLAGGASSHLPIAFLMLAVIGGLIGLINGIGVQFVKIPPLVMTLIMVSVVNGFSLAYTKGQPAIQMPPVLLEVGAKIFGPIRWLLIIAVIILIIMEVILRKSRYGRSLYLVGNNRRAAEIGGIGVNKIVILSYVLAGIIGIWSGCILVGYAGSAQLEMAKDYTLLSIAAVVIGGTKLTGGEGTLLGGVLGAIVLTILTSVLVAVGMPDGVRELIQGLTLLVILMVYSRAPKLRQ
ncbi:MAG: ABC transporter permease [Bacteroidetes bacterium]|nr:MAG: ABC transporter permease [Bacteroidota bacterium]